MTARILEGKSVIITGIGPAFMTCLICKGYARGRAEDWTVLKGAK